MSRMFHNLELLTLSWLFLTVKSQTGNILPPQNPTLVWIDDFRPKLSWTPPHHSMKNCTYNVATKDGSGYSFTDTSLTASHWAKYRIMEGGFLHWSVTTVCSNGTSKPMDFTVSYPDLVKKLECYIYAPQNAHCSWASQAPDVRFFYWLEAHGRDSDDRLQECSSYNYTDGAKTGCELQANIAHTIHILFNGTLNNTLVRNTFKKELLNDVRPPALDWTVMKSEDHFKISWSPPNILRKPSWDFTIKYTACNKIMNVTTKETSYQLERSPHCQYRIAVKAETNNGRGVTPWSAEKYFDRDSDALVYGAFIIPLVVAALAALTFICCRRNKEQIFPPIIMPRDLITDIENNNKSNLLNLHVAAEEEQTCEITVIDPKVIKLDC